MFKNYIVYIIGFLVLGAAIFWATFINNEVDNINTNKGNTEGVVVEVRERRGASKRVFYKFVVDAKEYKSEDLMVMCSRLSIKIEGRTFPVVYNKLNPKQARILITPKSFKRFNQVLPDNLHWVRDVCL